MLWSTTCKLLVQKSDQSFEMWFQSDEASYKCFSCSQFPVRSKVPSRNMLRNLPPDLYCVVEIVFKCLLWTAVWLYCAEWKAGEICIKCWIKQSSPVECETMAPSRWWCAVRGVGGNWMRQKARLAAWLLALDLAALCQGNADRQARLSQHISASLRNPEPCRAGQLSCVRLTASV